MFDSSCVLSLWGVGGDFASVQKYGFEKLCDEHLQLGECENLLSVLVNDSRPLPYILYVIGSLTFTAIEWLVKHISWVFFC